MRLSDNYNLEWGGGTNYIRGSNASNELKLVTNSTAALTLDSSQNATFAGRINPGEHIIFQSNSGYLQFPGASSRAWALASQGGTAAPGTNSATFGFHHWDGSSTWTNPINITASGKLGIGTDNPSRAVHIFDSTQSNQSVYFGNPAAAPYGEINYNSTGLEHLYIDSHGTTTGYGNIVFRTGPTPEMAMFIDATGRVGIGDSTPRARLEVVGGANEGIILKPNGQIPYTPTSSTFYNGLTFENAGSAHAFSIAYGQGGWLKFSHFDNASTYSELAQLRASGDFYPAGSVVMAQGEGINFAAAADIASGETVASSLLDDYEEGSFLPTLYAGSTSVTVSNNVGRYTKIGNVVIIRGSMTRNDSASKTGILSIRGLPFAIQDVAYLVTMGMGHMWIDNGTNLDRLGLAYINSDTYIYGVVDKDVRTGRYIQMPSLTNGRPVYFSVVYHTAT